MTVVEISPSVVQVARHYFGLPDDGKHLQVVVADGAAWVPEHPGSAEVLLLDGFEDGKQPAALCSTAFYRNAYKALRPGGIMAVNFMAEDRKLDTYIERIDTVFDGRTVMLSAEDNVNLIILAFKGGPVRIAWDTLRTRARSQQRALGLPTAWYLSTLRELNAHSGRYLRIAPEGDGKARSGADDE
jgi:spermidine synthase